MYIKYLHIWFFKQDTSEGVNLECFDINILLLNIMPFVNWILL